MIEFKKQYIVEIWKNIKNKITASMVKFSDGQTFQQKYDNGELKGDQGNPGKDGSPGTPGKDGAKGADGVGITSIDVVQSTIDGGNNVVTVNLSNGTDKSFNVRNGSKGSSGTNGKDGTPGAKGEDGTSITSVQQTTTSSSDGGTNVIKVTLSDGSSSTFQVKNGSKGSAGANGTNRY